MNDRTRILASSLSLPMALFMASSMLNAQTGEASPMKEHCRSMMTGHDEMMSEMRSGDARLDELITEMKTARGSAKLEALERVVIEMVEQRKQTMGKMMAEQPRMMQHMMQHMRKAMMEGNDDSMECPMMKQMMGSPEKGPGPHHGSDGAER